MTAMIWMTMGVTIGDIHFFCRMFGSNEKGKMDEPLFGSFLVEPLHSPVVRSDLDSGPMVY